MKNTDEEPELSPILAVTTRSGLIEQVYRGSVCLVKVNGEELFSLGDVDSYTYPRSALKFMQVLPLLESGAVDTYGLTLEEIAVMCASHNAEDEHLQVVESILKKAGVEATDFACGTHPSIREQTAADYYRKQVVLTDLHNNCSGKHAGFLALAQYLGAPLTGYLDPTHPVQVKVRGKVAEVFQMAEDELHLGTDGCSAPNYAMPVYNMALGFARLTAADAPDAYQKVVQAVSAHPFMVGGTDRFCTEMMEVAKGKVIGKLGAAGVYLFGFPGLGIGGAVKVADGLHGPQYNVVMELLHRLGGLSAEGLGQLAKWHETPVPNCVGKQVGETTVVKELFESVPSLFPQ